MLYFDQSSCRIWHNTVEQWQCRYCTCEKCLALSPALLGGLGYCDGVQENTVTLIVRRCFIRFERRLSEVLSAGECTGPRPAPCNDAPVGLLRELVNHSVADYLQRLNATRFTATSFDDGVSSLTPPVTTTQPQPHHTPVVTTDPLLIDFRFIWIVFMSLDALLVTRRIGNSSSHYSRSVSAVCGKKGIP